MAEVIPMEIPGTGPLKKSINNLFANAVEKAAEGKYEYIRKRVQQRNQTGDKKYDVTTEFNKAKGKYENMPKILQEKTDEIIRQTIQESRHDTTSKDSQKIMKYVAEFVDKIEINIDEAITTHVTLIPHDRQGKIFGINDIYCLAIKIFDNLMTRLADIREPLDFNLDYDYPILHPDSSYNQNMKRCNPLSMSQELGGPEEEPDPAEGGSKSRRRHRRKPVRKTRRGRTRKSKPKSKTHRRRRIHKNKKYTRKH